MKISVSSLGCRLNQAELQSVVTCLKESGHTIVSPAGADVIIVNTCVVTHTSERKTRKLIYQAQRHCRQGHVIVTGCYVQAVKEEGNTLYISNDYKYLIPEIIENDFIISEELLQPNRFAYPPATGSLRTRINLKIQDGCNSFCSYCIIPYVRGNPVSKPAQNIITEFKRLLDTGYHEFLITGVQIGMYSDGNEDLSTLIEKMLRIEGSFRIHLSSLSPKYMTSGIIDSFTSQRMVKHLHLSLQSGSNTVLHRMNRGYTAEEYLDILSRIRSHNSLFNFTTDLIVGFPDETQEEFNSSVSLVKEARFSHIHTFRYSVREGTAAAAMGDTVPETTKKERSKRIIDLYAQQKREYYSQFNNIHSTMLTERSGNGETSGFNEYYIPIALQEEHQRNCFVPVITTLDTQRMVLKGQRA